MEFRTPLTDGREVLEILEDAFLSVPALPSCDEGRDLEVGVPKSFVGDFVGD